MNQKQSSLFTSYFNWQTLKTERPILHENIERHTAHTIVSWPNPKQWVIVHTSDLMMIIRQSIYILSIITKETGKLKRHRNREFVFISIVQFMMSANSRIRFGLQIVLLLAKIWFWQVCSLVVFVTCQNLHFGKYVRWSCLFVTCQNLILASMFVGRVCLFVCVFVCLYGNFTKSQERLSQSSPNFVASKH